MFVVYQFLLHVSIIWQVLSLSLWIFCWPRDPKWTHIQCECRLASQIINHLGAKFSIILDKGTSIPSHIQKECMDFCCVSKPG